MEQEADENSVIRVVATFTDDTGQSVTADSAATLVVRDIAATVSVIVTGTAQPGQTLTAHAGSNDSDVTFTYQWQSSSDGGATFTNIAGATTASYTLQAADQANQIQVVVNGEDPDSNTVSSPIATSPAVHVQGMTVDTFVAVESATGDKIFGALYDNTGRYSVGSSVVQGTDLAGGHWTYTVTGVSLADAAHQDASYSGFVYDYNYFDNGLGTFNTFYGAQGFLNHNNDKVNFSGSNYLGSDGDLAVINNRVFAIASGKYVISDNPAPTVDAGGSSMQAVSYRAVESKTGDVITGVLFDTVDAYSVGSSVTAAGVDNAGGHWTYTVTNIASADSAHQSTRFSGFAYDQTYFDADRGTTSTTFYGSKGLATGDTTVNFSGNHGLGSDGDLITSSAGNFIAIASGKYVVADAAPMKQISYQAVESVTGDIISGVLFDNSGAYSVGSSVTPAGTDQSAGHWTYTVTNIATADAAHQSASYSGFAYDLTYFDADTQQTVSTFYGANGFNTGVNDRTVNYSGNGGLGSDGDAVTINGATFAVASGRHVVPERQQDASTMKMDFFTAVDTQSKDTITGVLFDNSNRYTVGSSVTESVPNSGAHWTYTVTAIGDVDAVHANDAYAGFVYDLSYFDNDTGQTYTTLFGSAGLNTGVNDRTANYSGNNGLGSDGDVVTANGSITSQLPAANTWCRRRR